MAVRSTFSSAAVELGDKKVDPETGTATVQAR
jgi:hypothetical protein